MKRYIAVLALLGLGLASNAGCQALGRRGCGPCQTSCRPGPIGWQRGGTHYQGTLSNHADYRYQQAGSGVVGAQVGYPYYTTRGPRDFFQNNPPTIGR